MLPDNLEILKRNQIPSLVADGLLEMNEEAIDSEGASSSSTSTSSDSGKEVDGGADAIPPASLPRLYSVDQEIGGPPPALKVRLMREKHVHYLINGAFEMSEKNRETEMAIDRERVNLPPLG